MFAFLGRALARYLQKELPGYRPISESSVEKIRSVLRPGDILLVEGNHRISAAIKYTTQSTWSHAAFYAGVSSEGEGADDDPLCLIEADVLEGVVMVPLSKYGHLSTRICRPVGLSAEDLERLVLYMKGRIGDKYDIRNVFDLMRYMLPEPPVPMHWRRRMLALGSGDPTRAICSTLIAQGFQSIRYPILPEIQRVLSEKDSGSETGTATMKEILHIRHHSLYAPRDFDISPYFEIVKPTLELGFDYKTLNWSEQG